MPVGDNAYVCIRICIRTRRAGSACVVSDNCDRKLTKVAPSCDKKPIVETCKSPPAEIISPIVTNVKAPSNGGRGSEHCQFMTNVGYWESLTS